MQELQLFKSWNFDHLKSTKNSSTNKFMLLQLNHDLCTIRKHISPQTSLQVL
jgi:hypothetical protein